MENQVIHALISTEEYRESPDFMNVNLSDFALFLAVMKYRRQSKWKYVRYRKNVRYIVYWKQFIRGIWRYRKKRCRNLWKRERNLYPQHEDHEIPPHGLRFCEEYQV